MKTFHKLSVLLVCLALGFMSMECDNSPEPPHPKYISYLISAELDITTFVGPEALADEFNAWIGKNLVYSELAFEYTTGAASEFAKHDAEAVKKYDPFKQKFTAFLGEEKEKLARGAYGKDVKVNATFRVFAERGQGQDPVLRSETITFTFP